LKWDRALVNQTAIVTGASSGIGRATALAFAQAGVHVALAARNEAGLNAVAREIEALGRKTLVIPTDVTSQDQVNQMVQETAAAWGHVDILVANAGILVRKRVVDLEISDIERVMATNFYGVLYAIKAVLPSMLERRQGHLVLVSSIDGTKGVPPEGAYVATKFALSGFGEVLRQELHGTGVTVSTIFPGRVATAMIDTFKVPWISAPLSSESVAKSIVRATRHRQPEVIIPSSARLFLFINTLSPRLGDWLVRFLHLGGWDSESE
jgi:NADP-dependent 3-hydroxy acid dehydrogenase YdfG